MVDWPAHRPGGRAAFPRVQLDRPPAAHASWGADMTPLQGLARALMVVAIAAGCSGSDGGASPQATEPPPSTVPKVSMASVTLRNDVDHILALLARLSPLLAKLDGSRSTADQKAYGLIAAELAGERSWFADTFPNGVPLDVIGRYGQTISDAMEGVTSSDEFVVMAATGRLLQLTSELKSARP